MKLLFALILITLQLFLVKGTSSTGLTGQIEKRAGKDLLSTKSCRYIKNNGYCHNLIKRKLCRNTCRCTNKLSSKSCQIAKAQVKCKTAWSIRFCRYTCGQCSRTTCRTTFPLGMESGAIPDSRITASSHGDKYHSPARARLHMKQAGLTRGGWSASRNNAHQWLQVDLGDVAKVTHIATQGRQDSYYNQWVRSYSLQYSTNGRRFADYKNGKIFRGNSDQNTVVKHALNPPIVARFIRVRPKTWRTHISMRMELYGCA